jgi:predicted membrane GTPase involved in stress response
VNGEIHEPFEQIVIDIEEQHQGPVMEEMGSRKAELKNMEPSEMGRIKLDFIAPSRGMIGFRSQFLTLTERHRNSNQYLRSLRTCKKRRDYYTSKWCLGLYG